MRRVLFLILILGLASTVRAADELTPMPTARFGAAAVAAAGCLVIGGQTLTSVLGTVEGLDTTHNTWTELPPMPTPRTRLAAVNLNGLVYAIGGSAHGKALGVVEVYDTSARKWSTRASLSHPRYRLAAAVVGGKIYAVGGTVDGKTAVDTLEVYDPETDSWADLTEMPTPRAGAAAAAAAVGDQLYVLGGMRVEDGKLRPGTDAEVFDTTRLGWSKLADLNIPRVDGWAYASGAIWIVGGSGENASEQLEGERYIDRSDYWATETEVREGGGNPRPRSRVPGPDVKVARKRAVLPPPQQAAGVSGAQAPQGDVGFPVQVQAAAFAECGPGVASFGGYAHNKPLALVQMWDQTRGGFKRSAEEPVPAAAVQGVRTEQKPAAPSPTAAAPPAIPVDAAVLVGVGPYGREDAQAMAAALHRYAGFAVGGIVTLTGNSVGETDIISALSHVPRRLSGRLLFFYSGYGSMIGSSPGDAMLVMGDDKPDPTRHIQLKRVYEYVANIWAPSKLVVLDTSFAGGGAKYAPSNSPGAVAAPLTDGKTDDAITVLAASDGLHPAGVSPDDRHGNLTAALLEGLKTMKPHENVSVLLDDLLDPVREGVRARAARGGRKQTITFIPGSASFVLAQ